MPRPGSRRASDPHPPVACMDSEFVARNHPLGNSNPIDLRGTPAVGTSNGKGTGATYATGEVWTDVGAATGVPEIAVPCVPYPFADSIAVVAVAVADAIVAVENVPVSTAAVAVDAVVRHTAVGDIWCIAACNGSGSHRSSTYTRSRGGNVRSLYD